MQLVIGGLIDRNFDVDDGEFMAFSSPTLPTICGKGAG